MTIIVEDGSIVTGANSYVSEAELTQYVTDRGITLTGNAEALLFNAMDYLETLDFIGYKYTEDQPLQWPRYDVYIDRYYVEVTEIPNELKKLQMAVAVAIDEGAGPLQTIDRTIKREKIDDIEVEYSSSSASATVSRVVIANSRKLVRGGAGGNNFNVAY